VDTTHSSVSGRFARVKRDHVALAVIVVGAAAVRGLELQVPMRYDEAFSFLTYAVHPVEQIVGSYGLPNNHVLNTILMHEAWQRLGNHLWSLRLPAYAAGCAIVPVAYLAGRALYGAHAGLWAAALMGSSAPLIDFSVNARGYTLGILFVLLALWSAALITAGRRSWPWPVFVAGCALAVWSVPTMALGLVALGAWAAAVLALRRDGRGLAVLGAGAAFAAVIAYLLYRPTLGQHGWEAGKEVARDWASLRTLAAATWASWNRATPWPLQVALGAAVVAALMVHRRIGRQPVPVLAGVALSLAASLATGIGVGLFPRYWLAYLPFVLLTGAAGLAWGVDRAARRREAVARFAPALPVAVGGLLCVLVLVAGQGGSEEPPQSDNGLARYLRDELKPGEVAAEPRSFGPAVDYDLLRDGLRPTVGYTTPPMREFGHAVVIAPGHDPAAAVQTMRALGAVVTKPPRLLRRFEFISVWDVPVDG
jgi:hypothetical protein